MCTLWQTLWLSLGFFEVNVAPSVEDLNLMGEAEL